MLRIVFIIFLFGAAGPWLSCLTLYWIHFWFCSYTYINNHFYKKRKEHFLRTYMSKYAITLSSVLIDNFTLVVVQLLSHVRLFATPWTAAHQASLSFTISQSLLKFTSIESVMPSNHLILSCPLLLLPSIFPSIRVFSNESALRIR